MKNYWLDRVEKRKEEQDKKARIRVIVDKVIKTMKKHGGRK